MTVWIADDEPELLTFFAEEVNIDEDISDQQISLVTISTLEEFKKRIHRIANQEEPCPSMIFLDLRFRSVNEGYAALEAIKKHPKTKIKTIPTIMFSSSRQPEEVRTVYEKSANVYVEKGSDTWRSFKNVLLYWKKEAVLPSFN